MIRPLPEFRLDAFRTGLERCGYAVRTAPPASAGADDLLVIWNRGRINAKLAKLYDAARASVLVAENGYLGREWRGGVWYAIARDHHNGAGAWPDGGPGRWESFGVELAPWRQDGDALVVLAQRGIGESHLCGTRAWAQQTAAALAKRTRRPVRIRWHPGEPPYRVSLEDDLRDAFAVVTWSSGAALKALLLGVPVFYGCPSWIGRDAARPLSDELESPFLGDRLPMLRRLAWAMWNVDEIATGEPFRCLTSRSIR